MTTPRRSNDGPRVKICGLRDPAQARACAELGAWGIGVVFADGPRRVDEALASRVVEGLPAGVARVGVFVDPDPDETAGVAGRVGLTHVQVHGRSDAGAVARACGLPVIEGIRVEGPQALARAHLSAASMLLFDAAVPGRHGGTGARFDWTLLEGARALLGRPFGVAGGLDADNVAEAVSRLGPDLIDVSSGVESAPGEKDLGRVERFLRAARPRALA